MSTHLLISAAHEILAVFDKTFLKTGMFFDRVEQYIKPELLEDFRSLMKTPSSGFKHGAKDLTTVVELPAIRQRFPAYDREGFRKAFYSGFEKTAREAIAAALQGDILPDIWQQMFPKQPTEKE